MIKNSPPYYRNILNPVNKIYVFSASTSFGAGIVLSSIDVASIKKTQTPSQVVFVSIPLQKNQFLF